MIAEIRQRSPGRSGYCAAKVGPGCLLPKGRVWSVAGPGQWAVTAGGALNTGRGVVVSRRPQIPRGLWEMATRPASLALVCYIQLRAVMAAAAGWYG